jgi:hypothetical protein
VLFPSIGLRAIPKEKVRSSVCQKHDECGLSVFFHPKCYALDITQDGQPFVKRIKQKQIFTFTASFVMIISNIALQSGKVNAFCMPAVQAPPAYT